MSLHTSSHVRPLRVMSGHSPDNIRRRIVIEDGYSKTHAMILFERGLICRWLEDGREGAGRMGGGLSAGAGGRSHAIFIPMPRGGIEWWAS